MADDVGTPAAPTRLSLDDATPVDPRFRRADPDGAAERLLDAAEMLVARHGVTVTDRAIVAASGHRNNSAISYHFGNRQGLLDAVWQRRTARVERRRTTFLSSRALRIDQTDRRTALTCWVTALADEMASLNPSYWARFNERILAERPLDFIGWVSSDLDRFPGQVPLRSLLELFDRLIELTHGGVQPAAGRRVALTVRFVITALAAWERDNEAGSFSERAQGVGEFVSELVELSLAILDAPSPDLDNSRRKY